MQKNLVFLDNINFCMLLGNFKIYVLKLNRTFVNSDKNLSDSNYYKCIPDHIHDEFEFHIIQKGCGFIKINGQGMEINAGELFVTGPKVKHMQSSNVSDPMFEFCLKCKVEIIENTPEAVEFFCQENDLIRQVLSKPYPFVFKDIYKIADIFDEVFNEAEKQIPGYYLKIQSLIISIIINLFRTIAQSTKIFQKYEMPQKSNNILISQKLREYVETNYRFKSTLEKVSNHLKISQKQINIIMKEYFNMTFHDYVLNYRFELAKNLLQTTNLSIDDVAYESGFSSIYYMYQVFKHIGAPTPLNYRKY